MFDQARLDLRFALRLASRRPLFALTAAMSRAIGIGATTAIFTMADALLLRDPPGIVAPSRLIDIGRTQDGSGFDNNSFPNYEDVRARARLLESVYAYDFTPRAMSLVGTSGAQPVYGELVTSNYFEALGTRPAAGRLFSDKDPAQPGSAPIVVLSHRLWMRAFDGDPRIAGRTIRLNGSPFTVAGVAQEGFRGTTFIAPDVWIPITMVAQAAPRLSVEILNSRASSWILMGGRLKQGTTLGQARAELNSIAAALRREYPDDNRGRGLAAERIAAVPGAIAPVRAFVGGLMIVTLLVLIIACANIAGVLLARATLRRREIALRMAIGARRLRLVGQMLVETVVLFIPGTLLGIALARVMVALLMSLVPALPVPVGVTLDVNGRAAIFATAVSLFAAVLSGLAPALHALKAPARALGGTSHTTPERQRLRGVFVVAQVAASAILVIGAALFVRAVHRAGSIDPGFDPHGLELTSVDLSLAGYTDETGPQFARQLIEQVRALPGVQGASLAAVVPLGNQGLGLGGLTLPGGAAIPRGIDWNVIEPDYFRTMRIPLLSGRDFRDADGAGAPAVAIINQTMAAYLWPHEDAVGKELIQNAGPSKRSLKIVAVARDSKYRSLGDSPRMFVYVPLQQQYLSRMTIVTRTDGARSALAATRAVVTAANPNLPVLRSQTFDEFATIALVPQRIAASVSGTLGIIGLLLASIGIYGVTAFIVASRTREIAVRTSLGAQRRDVLTMVLMQGLRLVAIGVLAGGLIAAAASRVASSLLMGIRPADPIAFGAGALLCCAAGLLACYVPARRATNIDPSEALRWE